MGFDLNRADGTFDVSPWLVSRPPRRYVDVVLAVATPGEDDPVESRLTPEACIELAEFFEAVAADEDAAGEPGGASYCRRHATWLRDAACRGGAIIDP